LTPGRSLDQHDARVASEILANLGVRKFRLVTDEPTADLRQARTA
jgi:GTP cyclohydrolase II